MSDPYRFALYQRNRRAVLEAAGYRCCRCGKAANTADHIVPLVMGGTHDLSNLRPMCRRCNSSLGAQLTNRLKMAGKVGRQSRRW
jgi:5-methylcytosine-specific restriction endonuclease McrA